MRIAIVIGHNLRSKGSYSTKLEMSEYEYCKKVAEYIKEIDDSVDIYERKPNKSYIDEMKLVIAEINNKTYDCIIELHFNSSTYPQANGCECLVHKYSYKAKNMAEHLLKKLSKEYNLKIRGSGLIEVENSGQRGSYGICKTKDPYILLEPFFGSNSQEAEKFINYRKFARFLIKAIRSW